MSELHIPKRNTMTSIEEELTAGRRLQSLIQNEAKRIATEVGSDDRLNEEVARSAKAHNFNRLMIQRLVEEVNTLSFNVRYDEKKTDRDRRVTFELAELDKVLNYMGEDAPGEVINPNFPNGFIEPQEEEVVGLFGKVASVDTNLFSAGRRTHDHSVHEKEDAKRMIRLAYDKYTKGIDKVANVIVQSGLFHKNANELFNTLISDVGLNKKATNDIIKSSYDKLAFHKQAKHVPLSFSMELEVNEMEKKADSLFGGHSLLEKTASTAYEKPVVRYTEDVKDYDDLVKLAHYVSDIEDEITKYLEVLK